MTRCAWHLGIASSVYVHRFLGQEQAKFACTQPGGCNKDLNVACQPVRTSKTAATKKICAMTISLAFLCSTLSWFQATDQASLRFLHLAKLAIKECCYQTHTPDL